MSAFLDNLYKNQSTVYKYFIYIASTVLIVFFFPKGGKFKYEFQKGKPWQYDNYYAPFDFSIKKTTKEIEEEKQNVKDNQVLYYNYDSGIAKQVYDTYDQELETIFSSANNSDNRQQSYLIKVGKDILDELYANGVVADESAQLAANTINLVKNNEERKINYNQLYSKQEVKDLVTSVLEKKKLKELEKQYQQEFFDIVKPNVFFDSELSKKVLEDEYSKLSYTRGTIDQGSLL